MIRKLLTTIPSCLSTCIVAAMFCLPAHADFFQYTDQSGTVIMVDDEGKIPEKYRKKTKITKSEPDTGKKVTSVMVKDNQVYVPVRLSYRSASVDTWLLLDTGATTTLISADVARRLGINKANAGHGMARIADGSVVETSHIRIDAMTVGPKVKFNTLVTFIKSRGAIMHHDGLLGMNFLRDLRYHLDMNNQTIEWQ